MDSRDPAGTIAAEAPTATNAPHPGPSRAAAGAEIGPRLWFVAGLAAWFGATLLAPLLLIFGLVFFAAAGHLGRRWMGLASCAFAAAFLVDDLRNGGIDLDGAVPAIVGALAGFVFADLLVRLSDEVAQRQQAVTEAQAALDQQRIAERRSAVFEERQRMARELHDTLAQDLTSIVMLLEASSLVGGACGCASGESERCPTRLALGSARSALSNARIVIRQLRPDAADRVGLLDALGALVDQTTLVGAAAASLRVRGYPSHIPPAVEDGLVRITQEALANVRAHAEAAQVSVTVEFADTSIRLRIDDDGRGFQPSTTTSGNRLGLLTISERAAELGAVSDINTRPGLGTTITVDAPLTAQAHR